MNEILDLLPIPAERDLPPGQLHVRREAFVGVIRAEATRTRSARRALRTARTQITRGWFSLLGILALVVVLAVGASGQRRTVQRSAQMIVAAVGVAQVVAVITPAARKSSLFGQTTQALRLPRLHLSEVEAS